MTKVEALKDFREFYLPHLPRADAQAKQSGQLDKLAASSL